MIYRRIEMTAAWICLFTAWALLGLGDLCAEAANVLLNTAEELGSKKE